MLSLNLPHLNRPAGLAAFVIRATLFLHVACSASTVEDQSLISATVKDGVPGGLTQSAIYNYAAHLKDDDAILETKEVSGLGVFISPHTVLTAAHLVGDVKLNSFIDFLATGRLDLTVNKDFDEFTICLPNVTDAPCRQVQLDPNHDIVVHPSVQFPFDDPSTSTDIALIHVKPGVGLSVDSSVRVSHAVLEKSPEVGTKELAIDGRMEGRKEHPHILTAKVPIATSNEFHYVSTGVGFINHLGKAYWVNNGDSGCPLYDPEQEILYGTCSYAEQGRAYFARTDVVWPWIEAMRYCFESGLCTKGAREAVAEEEQTPLSTCGNILPVPDDLPDDYWQSRLECSVSSVEQKGSQWVDLGDTVETVDANHPCEHCLVYTGSW